MKILHTADWHIGSFKGPEKEGVNLRSEDTMKCLRSLVETAEKEKPDLVLVSGDIFHQAEIWQGRSHKEVLQAREIILALSRAAGQVIVMRGTPNHDSEEAFTAFLVGLPIFAYGTISNLSAYKTAGSLITVLSSGMVALVISRVLKREAVE